MFLFFPKSDWIYTENQYYRPDCKECRKPVIRVMKEYIEASEDKMNAQDCERITCECD